MARALLSLLWGWVNVVRLRLHLGWGGEVLPGSWLISPQKYCPEILGLNCNNDDNDGRIIR